MVDPYPGLSMVFLKVVLERTGFIGKYLELVRLRAPKICKSSVDWVAVRIRMVSEELALRYLC